MELARAAFTAEASNAALVDPLPVKPICCGLSVLLSAIDMLADLALLAAGLNITEMTQEAAAATLEPHVFVSEKSPGFVPAIVIPVIVSAAAPVLVRTNGWAALDVLTMRLPKFQLCGTSWTVPAERLIAAPADLVLSVTEVAVSVTEELAGMDAGAVNVVGLEAGADPQAGEHEAPD